MKNWRITSVSIVALACTAIQANAQDYRYALVKLDSLDESLASDAAGTPNAAGDCVGTAALESIWLPRAVLWPRTGGVFDLGTLGGDFAGASSINDAGDIVGSSGLQPGGSIFIGHACLWHNGQIVDLGTLGGESSIAHAINDSMAVVGDSEFETGNYASRGFLWQRGHMIALPGARPESDSRSAQDINSLGEIVGTGSGLDSQYNGLIWRDGRATDLGSLAGNGSDAEAINDIGEIVGQSIAPNGNTHAVVWINDQISDIHDPQFGVYSWGQDINNNSQVIGAVGNALATRSLFILEVGQPMRIVATLLPPRTRTRWRIDRGQINDAGQITATAYANGSAIDRYALLLSPVHPTIEMAAPSPGTAGAANTLTVTGVTPGKRVVFLYSPHGGGTRIPGCDLQQNALQLDHPTVIGSAVANENGVATITRHVPRLARGQTILFQAVVQNECAISQLVVWQFE